MAKIRASPSRAAHAGHLSLTQLKVMSAIEHCRTAADPVGLAAAAKELAVAEAVSGKKAAVTSATISKEAIDLAKLRNSSQELSAVAYLSAAVLFGVSLCFITFAGYRALSGGIGETWASLIVIPTTDTS